jgi:hypothetical protein
MKKRIQFFLSLFWAAMLSTTILSAQFVDLSRSQSRSSQSEKFGDRLWYGGGFNLGFSGAPGVSGFQFGLSPMVGFKIFEPFSIGPRVMAQYNYFRARTINNDAVTAHPISWAAGVFMRYKVVPMFFAHVEAEYEDRPLVNIDFDRIQVLRDRRNNFYVGAGYTTSQGHKSWGYELSVLFNLADDGQTLDLPFILRFGITYNF